MGGNSPYMEINLLEVDEKYYNMKSRKIKSEEYDRKYSGIPVDFHERLSYMIDKYHLTDAKMEEILQKKQYALSSLFFYDYKTIELLEEPEGTPRPRVRILKSNYNQLAKADPSMVHVYVPGAGDDRNYMKRMMGNDLDYINSLIMTPCDIEYNVYFPTPSYFNTVDTFLAEIGLHMDTMKPDWDNIGKKYSDMYNHNMWLDDSLVVSGHVNKFYSILPRVEIEVLYLNYATNKYQYNNIIGRSEYNPEYPIGYLNQKGEPNA